MNHQDKVEINPETPLFIITIILEIIKMKLNKKLSFEKSI